MKYKIDVEQRDARQAAEFFSDYFAAKLDDPAEFNLSELHIFESDPNMKGESPKELSGEALTEHMKFSMPVFVAYGNTKNGGDVVPFMKRNGYIFSGNELTEEVPNVLPMEPKMPAEVPAPGGFAKLLAFFGIKLQSVVNYENYQKELANYPSLMDDYEKVKQNLAVAGRLSRNVDEELLEEDIRNAKRTADCNLIADTLVNQIVELNDPKMGPEKRAEINRTVRYSGAMDLILREFPDAPHFYAKLAQEQPDTLLSHFEETAAALHQEMQAEVQKQPSVNKQPVQKNASAPFRK